MTSTEKHEFLVGEWLETWADSGLDGPLFRASPKRILEIWDAKTAPAVALRENQNAPVQVHGECDVAFFPAENLSAETLALLTRMVLAMGLKVERVGVVTAGMLTLLSQWQPRSAQDSQMPFSQSSARCIVVLGENSPAAEDAKRVSPLTPIFSTHSLEAVLAQPGLKRAVWENLQLVMQKLKN